MGITCTLYRATENEIDDLLENPAAVRSFLDPDDGTAPPVRTVRMKGLTGFLLRLFPITITEVVSDEPENRPTSAPDPDRSVDLDKSWHGLHFLFTGTADTGDEPACYLVCGGEDLDDEGQIRALRPSQVRRFADYLSSLTPADLTRRYDAKRMCALEIYPDAIWQRTAAAHPSPMEYLLQSFSLLQRFVQRAAAGNFGVIIDIS